MHTVEELRQIILAKIQDEDDLMVLELINRTIDNLKK